MSHKLNFYPAMGLNPSTGYGQMALGLAKGLQSVSVEVLLYPDATYPTLITGYAPALEATHILPTRRWAFLMLESDKPNPELVAALNMHCERLIIAAPPLAYIYKENGVKIPVDVLPLGVDLFPINPLPVIPRSDVFTFLTYSYGDMRKGADLVVKAFQELFGDNPHFRLLIKAREGYQLGWLSLINHPRIQIIGGTQTQDEWIALLQQADCFVFPTRAEGWGMPPREATLAGIPTIATQWLGLWDVEMWGIPVPVKHFRPTDFHNNPFNAADAQWSEPDFEVLAEKMLWVSQHYEAAKRIAIAGRAYLLQHFTWRKVGETLKRLL
jgi:glycosyltransferase involved in cell wall biosynthesis